MKPHLHRCPECGDVWDCRKGDCSRQESKECPGCDESFDEAEEDYE